jgi:putative hydrolase of HD superfamily
LSEQFRDFMSSLAGLKIIPRSGWISHGVALQDVESVAEHAYSTCALAMLLADIEVSHGRRVNVERVLRLALLHDLAESLTFDISKSYLEYLGRKGELIKRSVEIAAWLHVVKRIQNLSVRRNYLGLLEEFNAQRSLEARIVQAADKLDLLFQIVAYHREGYPKAMLANIWRSTNQRLEEAKLPSVRALHKVAVREYRAVT